MNDDQSRQGFWLGVERKWWTLLVVALGTFMSGLIGSELPIALPIIGKETRSPFFVLEWIFLVFLLIEIATVLPFGRLGEMYGQRNLYITGLSIYIIAAILCWQTPGVSALIAFRALQGLGAGMIFALGPSVLTQAFPGEARGRALGLRSLSINIAIASGPVLGGLVTDQLGWRSVFWVPVPFGVAALALAFWVLEPRRGTGKRPFDFPGAITFAIAIASLLLVLTRGYRRGWGDPLNVMLIAAFLLDLVAFVIIELRIEEPMLDVRMFVSRMLALSVGAGFLVYLGIVTIRFIMPFYLIHGAGFSATSTGMILVSTPAITAATAWPAGRLSDKIGPRLPTTAGAMAVVVGMLLVGTLSPSSPLFLVILYLAIVGFGAGLFVPPNNSAIMGAISGEHQPIAGAVVATERYLGLAFGVAVSGLVYSSAHYGLGAPVPPPHAVASGMRSAASIGGYITAPAILLALLSAGRIAGGSGSADHGAE